MATSCIKFLLLGALLLVSLWIVNAQDEQVYIVYMGSSQNDRERDSVLSNHVELLASILGSEEDAQSSLVYSYSHAFTGFSAVMSKAAAAALSEKPGIVSVFPDPLLELHTTHSWDFLDTQSGISAPAYSPSGDTIIGMLDTGIWPESPSFSDGGIGPVPSRWKGVCMGGQGFTCNRKIIGARYYKGVGSGSGSSARDSHGHGTHTASTAGGSLVNDVNYYGLAKGNARGGSTTSRIAVYRVCSEQGCLGSDILAGLDDAIHDGVDVISVSLGAASVFQFDFASDPIAIGAFHAAQRGVLVVCSAGNDGPDAYSVVNSAPWIFTVAATTMDRDFQSDIILGNGKIYKGEAINFSNLSRSDMYPLVFAGDIAANTSSSEDASNCYPGSLDPQKVKGKIVICSNGDSISKRMKKAAVQSSEGKGMIVVDEVGRSVASNFGSFPSSAVSDQVGAEILSYMKSTSNPLATILRTVTITNYKPAPSVAFFSSRGPGSLTENILKPDISAPGVNILAAWIPNNQSTDIPAGGKPSYYSFESGTSMACPHVSGTVAFLKSANPSWSISTIKSALMTTATAVNNVGGPITNDSNMNASFFDFGAGEISPLRALTPGLVYETTGEDYLLFLCYLGYKQSQIDTIAGVGTNGSSWSCPSDAVGSEKVSNVNYPSIAIGSLEAKASASVTRTLTNVAGGAHADSVYQLSVQSPPGLDVKVSPNKLVFSQTSPTITFHVVFTATEAANKGYSYGTITWEDGTHTVRTPFAVNVS
uniref:TSA: Wollemia nobilis Ref_Wollemi_Transcript_1441_2604 transcribed RNA sequence n=1 Tax=Wollemia nobilis TaxID=56998 RepID=A0A0C9SAZ1_9CONI